MTRIADSAASKLASIDAITDKAAKESAAKLFSNELDGMEISVLRKAKLQESFSAMKKKLDAENKARQAADTKKVQTEVQNYFEKEEPNATYLVKQFDVGNNSKALSQGIAIAKKLNKAVYLFSEELIEPRKEEIPGTVKAKVPHANFVPPQDARLGLNAKEWAEVVTKSIGGRAGGKPESAQGVGEEGGDALKDALLAAKRFYELKTTESKMPMQ